MRKQPRIGLVGMGFVGGALCEGMSSHYDVYWYDKHKPHNKTFGGIRTMSYHTLVEMVDSVIFVCVPTPMRPDGTCDTSIVEEVLAGITNAAEEAKKKIIVVFKSTLPPGTTQRLENGSPVIFLAYNPEFLREATAIEDFKNQKNIIIGALAAEARSILYNTYIHAFPNAQITLALDPAIAEMVKYTANSYLATKVSFANEVEQVCAALGIPYEAVSRIVKLDPRMGQSHWAVPGPDGKHGFGGSCFPKDLNGMIAVAKQAGVQPNVLQAAWETNLVVRPEKDWEQLKGRAVSQ